MILLRLAISILPLGMLARIDVGSGIALSALDCVMGLLFIYALPLYMQRWKVLMKERTVLWVGAFAIAGFLGLVASLSQQSPLTLATAFLYMCRFIAYAQLLWLVGLLEKPNRDHVLSLLVVAGVVSIAFGLLQYVLYPDLRNLYYAGWDEHVYRLFGTLLDPNYMGAFIMSFIAAAAMAAKVNSKVLYRIYARPIVAWMLGVAAVGAVVLTFSRSTYLMTTVSMSAYALLQRTQKLKTYAIGIGVFICFIALAAYVSPRFEGTKLFRTASIDARLTEYSRAITIFSESPLVGTGFNAYRYAQLRHGFLDMDVWLREHAGAGVPNSYLFVLATTGVIGAGVYTGLWVHLIRRAYHRKDIVLLAFTAGLSVHALFENSLFYPHIMFVVFVLYGYSEAQGERPKA